MKFPKLTALLLVLLLILSVFASCKNDEIAPEDPTGDQTEETNVSSGIDLSAYTIIRSVDAASEVVSACAEFTNNLKAITGSRMNIRNDASVGDNDNCEILVGDINRPQSVNAKAALTKLGFSISINENKIVIVASNDLLLTDALKYFTQSSITKLSNGRFYVPANHTETYRSFELSANGKSQYAIIFSNDDEAHKDIAMDLAKGLKEKLGVSYSVFENKKPSGVQKAIYIGNFEGHANDFAYDRVGIRPDGDDLYIQAWNRDDTTRACNVFLTRLDQYRRAVGSDTASIVYPNSGLLFAGNLTSYDIPLPQNLKYTGANDTENKGVILTYENCSAEDYEAYRERLTAQGYTLYFNRTADTNRFSGYYLDNLGVWTYYLAELSQIRVIMEPYSGVPSFAADGEKVTEAKLTQFGVNYDGLTNNLECGMGYVITLEDGRYIVIDGCMGGNVSDRLYNFLKNNNKRKDGRIVVAAWIITHAHTDHYESLQKIALQYASKMEIEYLICNIPSNVNIEYAENVNTDFLSIRARILSSFKNTKLYVPHTGYAATIGGVGLEILSTYENLFPNTLTQMNDTSMVFRFIFNPGQRDEAKAIFLADSYNGHSDLVAAMWGGTYLKSAIVQVAHHGWDNGGSRNLYSEIGASYALWSNSQQHQTHATAYGSYTRKLLQSVKSTVRFYPASDENGNARHTHITFKGGINVTVE